MVYLEVDVAAEGAGGVELACLSAFDFEEEVTLFGVGGWVGAWML